MAMKKNNRDYIAQMNKGMKQKLSMLLIACLLFTGYHGLTISGRAEQEEKEQTNEISVSGTQVKVQLLGEDIRRAAKEAVEKGDRVEATALQGYSGDEDLQKEYAEIFSSEKEVYEIPLDSISEGLSESLAEEEAGLQVFVERDAKDLERLVRKESKESLLLYDKNSQLTQLFPKNNQEETKAAVEKEQESGAEEALVSDSNIEKTERNTELTGSELITFLYKNKADHRISFQLSVDGNTYPKVVVSPKTQLFKSFLDKLKKEEKKTKQETTAAASTEAKESAAEVKESKEESAETKVASENTESNESESSVSSVSLVSTEGSEEETTVAENVTVETAMEASAEEETIAEETTEAKAGETETTVAGTVEKSVVETKATEVKEDKAIFEGFLQEVIEHYEEFLGELQTARFAQYSLNELGRKTQNVEIKDFVTVEVFYDEDAFDEEVVLEAKRLVKPEEEGEKEGEKLTEEQIKLMQDTGIYDDTDSLDIRFISKKDQKEVEPKENKSVTVRLTFDKKAVPEEASADTIAIHHIVEKEGKAQYVETVLRSETEKKAEERTVLENRLLTEGAQTLTEGHEITKETLENKKDREEQITKEFTVNSFSAYIVNWTRSNSENYEIRFHYVDRNFKEIAPTLYTLRNDGTSVYLYYQHNKPNESFAYKKFPNYDLQWVGLQHGAPYSAMPNISGEYVYYITSKEFRTALTKDDSEAKKINFNCNACYHDFYFIYNLDNCSKEDPKERNINPDLLNEKYITDNRDGTYDLILTGQVKKPEEGKKQKLDIVFAYDNTAIMATDFGFNGKLKKLGKDDYASENNAKSTKVKSEVANFMKKLSSNSAYDVHYALVTMDGDKGFGPIDENQRSKYTPEILSSINYTNVAFKKGSNDGDINLVGDYIGRRNGVRQWLDSSTDDEGKSHGFNVIDKAYNDTKHLYGFTNDPNQIITQLTSISEKAIEEKKVSGENYVSAIRNIKVLLGQSGNYQVADGGLKNGQSKARNDAQKIVIFIAGGSPKFAYVVKDGIYEDTHRYNDSDYYMIRRNYEEGWSIGNGYSVDFAALNQARGELHSLTVADAFYSIGVGNKENWKYLNDFAMGQYYDEDGKHREGDAYNEQKHPDRREKALQNNIRYKCFDASSEGNLKTALQQIYEREATLTVKNIEIEDILTPYVKLMDPYNVAVKGQLVKMRPNINADQPDLEVDHILTEPEMEDMGLKGFSITKGLRYQPAYNGNRWVLKLKTDPEDFSLPQGYEIRMVAKVELTDVAKKYFKEKDDYPNVGEDRTDLESIFQTYLRKSYIDPDNRPAESFNTSAGKPGFFTNEEATITYKYKNPNGGEGGGSKKYQKPVVRPNGYLKIEKIFEGIGEGFINTSTGELTELGKKIMKQVKFTIYEDEAELLSFNLGELIGKQQPIKVAGKYDLTVSTVQRDSSLYKIYVTIDNIPLNRRYRIKEHDISKDEVFSDSAGSYSYQFVDLKPHSSNTLTLNSIYKSTLYTVTNIYKPITPTKSITIEKQVEEFAKQAFSTAAREDKFDFYLALYKKNGESALIRQEYLTYLATLTGKQYEDLQVQRIKTKKADGTDEEISAIHFTLKDGDRLQFPLKGDMDLRIFEMKKVGYEAAKVEINPQGNMTYKEETAGGNTYTSINRLNNQGQNIIFRNPKISPVPTGLRGDITPYILSIFGFTLMAGAYFAIMQKKRREI